MKLRGKVNTLTKGLRGVSEKAWDHICGSQATAEKLAIELVTVQHAAQAERSAARQKKSVDEEILRLIQQEQALQAEYAATH